MTYDSTERRNTPLARKLQKLIGAQGPISVDDYMHACLHDADYGYYRHSAAIGAEGDFITAPEVTQVFGEVIGLWCAVVWQTMGSPGKINIVELGPGRGTLMLDLLRAAKIVPGFREAVCVHLVESNTALIDQQAVTLATMAPAIQWHDRLHDVPAGPTIIVANEFLDTVPVDQIVKVDEGWRQRGVSVDQTGKLCFVETQLVAEQLSCATIEPETPVGSIKEAQHFEVICHPLAERAAASDASSKPAPLAALFIDYGYCEPQIGDTLQAVRQHSHEHPLTSPGEADLTAYVDFAAFDFQSCGLAKIYGVDFASDGPVTQAEFLGSLGIGERTARLMHENASLAGDLELATARLMAPQGMGTRFKVLGIRSKKLPPLPGFDRFTQPGTL